ncbi:MAG: hypothetical protein ABIK31_07915 [candidate division WOR-3 bacterium]
MTENKKTKENKVITETEETVEGRLTEGLGNPTKPDIKDTAQKTTGNQKIEKGLGSTTNPDIKPTSEPAKPTESSSSTDNQQSSSGDKK